MLSNLRGADILHLEPGLPFGIGIEQLDGFRWVDGRDGMFVDDLRAVTSDKLDREVVEPFDLALKPDPIHKKHRNFDPVIAEMLQECVLER
jgi:hypothetical protein